MEAPGVSEYEGEMAVCDHGIPLRVDRGRFSILNVLHSGDWVLAQKAYPDPEILAYRVSDGSFASMPWGAFRSIAVLGPKD